MRFLAALLIAATIPAIEGCGSRSKPTAISGTVTFDGRPLANAQIRLFSRQNDAIYATKFATQTDAGGNYRLAGLMPGVYRAEVSKRGEAAPIPDYDARMGQLQFVIPETPIDQSLTVPSLFDQLQDAPVAMNIRCYLKRDGKTVESVATLQYARDWFWFQRGLGMKALSELHQVDR